MLPFPEKLCPVAVSCQYYVKWSQNFKSCCSHLHCYMSCCCHHPCENVLSVSLSLLQCSTAVTLAVTCLFAVSQRDVTAATSLRYSMLFPLSWCERSYPVVSIYTDRLLLFSPQWCVGFHLPSLWHVSVTPSSCVMSQLRCSMSYCCLSKVSCSSFIQMFLSCLLWQAMLLSPSLWCAMLKSFLQCVLFCAMCTVTFTVMLVLSAMCPVLLASLWCVMLVLSAMCPVLLASLWCAMLVLSAMCPVLLPSLWCVMLVICAMCPVVTFTMMCRVSHLCNVSCCYLHYDVSC